eukprot:GHVH01016102.1.p1 GENE.GHVH01016102.1~~GHVH01016102.1.p1  ORF type:complete len:610 (+),score=58.09 GHVH01016102.1:114-1943(+)
MVCEMVLIKLFLIAVQVFGSVSSKVNYSLNNDSFPATYNDSKHVPIFIGRIEKDRLFGFYEHSILPICDFYGVDGDNITTFENTIGSRLVGQSWAYDPRLPVVFGQDLPSSSVCKLSMTTDVVREASQLIKSGAKVTYWIDGMPTVGYLGVHRNGMDYLYKHRHFDIVANHERIVAVDVTPSEPIHLVLNSRTELTYSATFKQVDELVNSQFTNTIETRFERYLTLSPADLATKAHLDSVNLTNSIGLTGILACLSGFIFQQFLGDKSSDQQNSSWSVTANVTNLSALRNQVFRRPVHTVLTSILISLGGQLVTSTIAFAIYCTFMLSESDFVFQQLDGRILNPLIGSYIGSSVIGGTMGGNFIKAWGVRRYGIGFIAQVGVPFMVGSIVFIQYRTMMLMDGSSLALSFKDCLLLLGYAASNMVGHFIGFVAGRGLTSTLEAVPPVDSTAANQLASAPPQGRFNRAILLLIPPILAQSISAGPFFFAFKCTITSFCVQDSLSTFFLTVLVTWTLLAVSNIVTTYLLLCLGDGRWQWNAARTGVLHGIIQAGIMTYWFVKLIDTSSVVGSIYGIGLCSILGILTSSASTMICYYSSSSILLVIYDNQKTE